MRCVNRAKYGNNHRIDSNGAEVGCDNKSINENVLAFCMKYILERIQISRSEIVEQLISEIKAIQQNEPTVNTDNLRAEIDKLTRKKHKAIDLMLEELITKDDLREQTEFYDSEIALVQDVNSAHKKQLDGIRNYIAQVNATVGMDTNSTKIYGELLKKVIVHNEGVTDFYLNCVPFGFRMTYHLHRYNRGHQLDVLVDNCEVIY